MRTRFGYATRFCVRDFAYAMRFNSIQLEFSSSAIFRTKLGAIYVRDLSTRRDFAYATRFFDATRIAYAKDFAYAKRRMTSAPKSRTQTFLNAMPENPIFSLF